MRVVAMPRPAERGPVISGRSGLFRHPGAGELLEQTARAWEFINGLPVPRFVVYCPVCRTDDVQYSRLQFFRRKESTHTYRADVRFKCRECASTWLHGVAVPEEEYPKDGNKVSWTGKQVANEIGERYGQ